MSFYDQNRPFGAPIGTSAGTPNGTREAPPVGGLSWTDAAYLMRIHKQGFHPPAHMRGMTLAQLEANAREETREAREAQEAKERAARIENAPKAIERALLDGPSPKRALPPQRGWRLRVKYPKFASHLATIVEERHRQNADDLKLRAGEPRTRPYFFRGKQIGEQVIHDDRALMFLLKLEDGQRARAEAREERREQRAHEIRLKEMEIEARRPAATPIPEMHASDVHPAAPVEAESPAPINYLPAVPADIAPPQVMEVPITPSDPAGHLVAMAEAAIATTRDGGGVEPNSSLARSAGQRYGLDGHSAQVPPQGAEGVEKTHET